MSDIEEKDDSGPTDVAFLYKTMIQRDPSKRRVKPVEKHLMQIHFGMSDDDTDSDYEFKPDPDAGSEADDIDFDEGDEDAEEKGGVSSTAESNDSSSSEVEEDDETIAARKELEKKLSSLRVCSVCVNSYNREDDEIIECDGCGILVHEGCYGVEEDNISISSQSVQSDSTEPWFCDSCKAGITPTCELCPNTFGIYKQTDTGRWVHLICALYVPGVAFGNTQKLNNVTLLEMPYSKWGAKECSLCDDDNYSYSGVCVGCDAGMCKTFFHVSCAQKHGLLSEASVEEEIADPFYAHCKMHGDKLVSKQKKRNFLALQSHFKQFQEERENRPIPGRIQKRLNQYINRHKDTEAKRPPAWVPPAKLPRALSSSATAIRSLLRKAELLGMSPLPKSAKHITEFGKKSYVAPALSIEFSSYYHERNHKIDIIKKQNKDLMKANKRLKSQEAELRSLHDTLKASLSELDKNHEENRQAGLELWNCLLSITEQKTLAIPEIVSAPPKRGLISSTGKPHLSPSITDSYICGICSTSKEQHQLAKCDQCNKHYHLDCLDPPLTRMPKKSKLCGWVCSICDHGNSQTEGPLKESSQVDTEAPRRLRQTIKEPIKFAPPEMHLYIERNRMFSHSQDLKPEINKPSRKRLKPRKLKPGKPLQPIVTPPLVDKPMKPSTSTSSEPSEPVIKKPKLQTSSVSDSPDTESVIDETKKAAVKLDTPVLSPLQAGAFHKAGRRSKVLETGTCLPCQNDCNGSDAVTCDICKEWFHFHCLSPPQKKSPKHKGYSWNCTECEKKVEYTVVNKVCADIPKPPKNSDKEKSDSKSD